MAQLPLIFNLNYQRIWLADLGNALVWHGGLGRTGSAGVVCWPPTLYWKNQLFFNEYLGIFIYFKSKFIIFLNQENGLFPWIN